MKLSLRSGAANPAAIIAATGVLILCLAGAIYLLSLTRGETVIDVDSSASSSSVSSHAASASTNAATSTPAQQTSVDQAALDGCLNAATAAHNERWADACADQRERQQSLHLACMQNQQDEAYCDAQFGDYNDIGDDCDLPAARSAVLNAQYSSEQQSCRDRHGA